MKRSHGVTLSVAYNPDGVDDFEAYHDPKADLAYTKFIRRFVGQSPAPGYPEGAQCFSPLLALLYRLLHPLAKD